MKAEFYRPDAPQDVVGSASWRSGGVEIQMGSEEIRRSLQRIFRRTPVAIDDPSLRPFGTEGPVVLQPEMLTWFQAAAQTRSQAEGLSVRLVGDEQGGIGFDPAGAYLPFFQAIERKAEVATASSQASPEPPAASDLLEGPAASDSPPRPAPGPAER